MAEKIKTVTLHVLLQEGDFNIISFDDLTVRAGENVGFSVDVQPLLGYSKDTIFDLTGLPNGFTYAWQNSENTWTPTLGHNLVCVVYAPLDNTLVGDYFFGLRATY